MELNKIYHSDAKSGLKTLPDESINMACTSPPYWGLRAYGTNPVIWDGDENCQHEWVESSYQRRSNDNNPGKKQSTSKGLIDRDIPCQSDFCCHCSAWKGELGAEPTPELFVQHLVDIFREVKRVLRDDGVFWLNLGDSYMGGKGQSGQAWSTEHLDRNTLQKSQHQISGKGETRPNDRKHESIKPKDLVGIPWMTAFALRADGWWLRQDIIWCLSGGTWVYVRTQKGDMPMMIKDLVRLNPSTVRLWNGKKWTELLGMSKSQRKGTEIEIVLRSGERISCTPNHKFPTDKGVIEASQITIGCKLQSCQLPEPDSIRDCVIDNDAAWLAGLYIAEGSRSDDTIQIAGHVKEIERWDRLRRIAEKFGGYITKSVSGNKMDIRLYGKILSAIIDEFVSGKTAKDKGFTTSVWKYSNSFLESLIDGYLSGDAHIDNNRYRIGFCRNYNLERDLRTACARLGYTITLNTSESDCNGKKFKSFRGEIRKIRSGHFNEKDRNEVVEIRKARCRYVYDLGVKDNPHLFALASGILTHNSKPNPMPESVTDRCTKSHEYIFLLSKSQKYYYDYEAILEPANYDGRKDTVMKGSQKYANGYFPTDVNTHAIAVVGHERWSRKLKDTGHGGDGTGFKKHSGCVNQETGEHIGPVKEGLPARNKRSVWTVNTKPFSEAHFATFPEELIEPMIKAGCPENGIVLDPFFGSGTTGKVSRKLNRNYIGIELNPEYIKIAENRILPIEEIKEMGYAKTKLNNDYPTLF